MDVVEKQGCKPARDNKYARRGREAARSIRLQCPGDGDGLSRVRGLLDCKFGDLLRLVIVEDSKIFRAQVSDRVSIGIPHHNRL
jgi:hypothetical protein